MTPLKKGDKAPVFSGKDQDGNIIKLSDFAGKKLVLFFYPKDNTSGCTTEACNLRDNYTRLKKEGFNLLGISPDSEKSHKGFISKHQLPYPLIADNEKNILNSFGVWQEKKMYGRLYMGVARTTFIIDEKGIIEDIIEKVDTKDHSNQILNKI